MCAGGIVCTVNVDTNCQRRLNLLSLSGYSHSCRGTNKVNNNKRLPDTNKLQISFYFFFLFIIAVVAFRSVAHVLGRVTQGPKC